MPPLLGFGPVLRYCAHLPHVREKGSLSLTRSLVSRLVSKLSISPSTIFLAVIAVIDSGLMASLG